VSYDGLLAETINVAGHGGDLIPAYLARPLRSEPTPGVVVIHHNPGYDLATKEITRTFAVHGYTAICPNLHHRDAPGADSDDASAAMRAAGGVPDERALADIGGAVDHLRSLATASGKVGVIGYCSGGRHAYLAACTMRFEAAVDCYGGRVAVAADQLSERQPMSAVDLTASLSCPLLGLFGVEDRNPDPAQVARIEDALRREGKEFQFHSYEGAGHAFFSVDRPSYRPEAAADGWSRILGFFARHLKEE
jgi:carboxymethylenebutenolidase